MVSGHFPAVFLDRDGTLMEEVDYCREPEKVRLLPGVPEGLAKLKAAGFRCVIITNQSGIGRGRIKMAEYEAVHARLLELLGSGLIARLFTPDPEVLMHATRALWIVSLAFPLYAAGMCLEGAFNGSGDTWTPTRLNFFCFWLGQVPFAWILAQPLKLGPLGVFISVPLSFSVLTAWSWVLFKRGKWKQQVV